VEEGGKIDVLQRHFEDLCLKIAQKWSQALICNIDIPFERVELDLFLSVLVFNLRKVKIYKILVHSLSFAEGVQVDWTVFRHHLQHIGE